MKIVIIGGGPAGCMAALLLKQQFQEANVTIIERQSAIAHQSGTPYVYVDFPTAEFIQQKVFESSQIEVQVDTDVISVNKSDKTISTQKGDMSYDYLVFAVGCQVKSQLLNGRLRSTIDKLTSLKANNHVFIVGNTHQAIKLAISIEKRYKCKVSLKMDFAALEIEANIKDFIVHECKKLQLVDQIVDADYQIDMTYQKSTQFSIAQEKIVQDENVFAIGSCCFLKTSQQFIYSQTVHLAKLIKGLTPPPLKFMNNQHYLLNGKCFGRAGMCLAEAQQIDKGSKLVTVKDSYRAEFMPTHEAVYLNFIVNSNIEIVGVQIFSRHDVSKYMEIAAIIIYKQMKAIDLILQDFFFQPHFGKPFHIFNVAAVAAVGKVPPYEEYK